jgi:hypothetical protein
MITNEGHSFPVTFKVFDADGTEYTPATARYRIHCVTNNRSIRSFTEIGSPAHEMEIDITPDDNVILTESSRLERRLIEVQTDYDTDSQRVYTAEWDVRNLP